MHVYFRDHNEQLVFFFIAHILELPKMDNLEISAARGNPLDMEVDAIVSPANSFGFMDGGIDWAYTQRFGPHLQETLQRIIQENGRELLVGEAIAASTNDPLNRIGWCISAPTMRVPKLITDHMDVFLATRAAVSCARMMNFKSIVMPGMGTGVGQVPYPNAAKAMVNGIVAAMSDFVMPKTWREAQDNHAKLRS